MRLAITILLFAVGLHAAEIIPADRLPPYGSWRDYDAPGIEGGIPNRTTVFCNVLVSIPGTNIVATGDGVTDDKPALQAAINLCPSNQVVYAPTANYKLNSVLAFNVNHSMVLRGDGQGTVIDGGITFTGGDAVIDLHNVLTGATRGSTNITIGGGIADPPEALEPGWFMILKTDGTNTLVQRQGYEGGPWPENPQGQIIEILTVTNMTNLTFKPPIYFDAGSTVKLERKYSSTSRPNYVVGCGLESFKLIHNPAASTSWAIRWERVARCWVTNVTVTNSSIGAMSAIPMYRCNWQANHIQESSMAGSGGGYGLLLEGKSTLNLIEDNIVDRTAAAILADDGSAGNVIAYNFCWRTKFYTEGWNIHSMGTHSCHPMMNLFEGNVAINHFSDFIHGSSSHNTFFRNMLFGWYTNALTTQNICFQFHAWNQYANIVGNVLGTPGQMTTYEMEDATMNFNTEAIYAWGYNGTNAYNPNAEDTALRHMNWNSVTTTNNGLVLDATISETNLVDSYYLDSKPSFFGTLVWPPIGPEINTNMTDQPIPAMRRYYGDTNYLTGATGGGSKGRGQKAIRARGLFR